MNRIVNRIKKAIVQLDLGIPSSRYRTDFLGAVNSALRESGFPPLNDLQDRASLLRAAINLEGAVE